MSTIAVIVFAVVALLLLAMLAAALRKSSAARAEAKLGPVDDDVHPYRSHAEASRRASGGEA